MLDVRRLSLLHDLAHLGTIAAVAKARTFTPSAVSQQLAALEREAGVQLLERSGRRVVLTPAGVVLVKHAETVLAALEQAAAAVAAARDEVAGPLRIGGFPTAVRTLLPQALVLLGNQHPGLELMVTELDPVDVPEALRERRLDVALVHDYDVMPDSPDGSLDDCPLLEETVFLAVPAGTVTGGVRSTKEMAWIAGSPGTVCHAVAVQLCRSAGFAPQIRHHADDFAAVLALVAAGQGVSLVPQLAAGNPPSGIDLLPLRAHRRTRVTYRSGASSHPAISAFVAAVKTATASYLSN
jgi:DNA-binding transcriptional LysR family regulator